MSSPLSRAVEAGTRLVQYRRPVATKKGDATRETILEVFRKAKEAGEFPPVFEDLMAATGLSSTATITHHVRYLVKQGKLRKHRRHYVLAEESSGEG